MITHLQVLEALRAAGHTTSDINSVMRRLAAKELRDEFAMAALPALADGIWAEARAAKAIGQQVADRFAEAAYAVADSMLAERDK